MLRISSVLFALTCFVCTTEFEPKSLWGRERERVESFFFICFGKVFDPLFLLYLLHSIYD